MWLKGTRPNRKQGEVASTVRASLPGSESHKLRHLCCHVDASPYPKTFLPAPIPVHISLTLSILNSILLHDTAFSLCKPSSTTSLSYQDASDLQYAPVARADCVADPEPSSPVFVDKVQPILRESQLWYVYKPLSLLPSGHHIPLGAPRSLEDLSSHHQSMHSVSLKWLYYLRLHLERDVGARFTIAPCCFRV